MLTVPSGQIIVNAEVEEELRRLLDISQRLLNPGEN